MWNISYLYSASVYKVLVYIKSHLVLTGTLWGSQTKHPFIEEESVDCRGQWTRDHTSVQQCTRQKQGSSPCYSQVAPTQAPHLRAHTCCMYQKHDLIHSIIKRGIRYSLIKGLYQNNTNQLCQDISDKNWETSQCVVRNVFSLLRNEATCFF